MARRTKAKSTDTKSEKPAEDSAAEEAPVEPIEIPDDCVFIGKSTKPEYILLKLANRHGLITGATGTGKTVTLQGLAESFSDAGVPVFCADVKGDLSGVAAMGKAKPWIEERAAMIGYDVKFTAHPVIFWDLFGEQGHPVRTTVSELGPLMLSRLMDLSEAQEGVLNIAFRIADDEKLPLLDLKDLQSLLEDLARAPKTSTTKYGTVSKVSIGAIQRQLLVLEQQGGDHFFGEPALDVGKDLMRTDDEGRGYIGVLAADKLMQSPRLYATFLLFLLSELFEELPEIGDPKKPKLVFFFDEAHLLFRDAPKALLEKVEQVVRLIRSKGVGVYFVTQNPRDVPDTVSRQLGNRVQHALRAFTPAEQKATKSAAETFRPNPDLDTEQMIMSMGIGEALVSTLDEKGQPSMVQHTYVKPPSSQVGPIAPEEREALMEKDPVAGKYDESVDRESAHEILQKRTEERAKAAAEAEKAEPAKKSSGGSRGDGFWTALGKSVVRAVVPMATRVLEDAIRRNALGGQSRGGYKLLDAGEDNRLESTEKEEKESDNKDDDGSGYEPFQTIPPAQGASRIRKR
ncbi:helicase HerA-like domain-containing protein [Methyloceanibacter methanicus]|nr:helicase HerA-like domain-containing protein [Methyloceanibacter methanicus]